jgi:methionine transaminase
MHINSKLPNVGTTIFTTMSVLAQQHNAINLGQGFPDIPMPERLTQLVTDAIKNLQNQYTHMNGYLPLRTVLANKYNNLHGTSLHEDHNITVTPGASYAIFTALTTILQPHDEVIVLEPAYDCYVPTIEMLNATPICIPLSYTDFSINWTRVQEAITPKTRAIIINNPHNPTGAVLQQQDLDKLVQLTQNTNIIIISDEVYEHLFFGEGKHQSLLQYPALFERTYVVFSFGKTYHCTGWKLGYCIAPEYLMKEFRKIHQFNAFTCNTPLQVGIANYITENDDYNNLGAIMHERKQYFEDAMKQTKFIALPSYGSYFQLYSYQNISTDKEFDVAVWLTKTHGVTAIPVSVFYKQPVENKLLRFCFAKTNNVLDAAVERLMRIA